MKFFPYSTKGVLAKALLLGLGAVVLGLLHSHSGLRERLDPTPDSLQLIAAGNARHDGPKDMRGYSHDWIKLKNSSDSNCRLSDFNLADSYNKPVGQRLPNILLEPGQEATVFASGKNQIDSIYRFGFTAPARRTHWKPWLMPSGNGKVAVTVSQQAIPASLRIKPADASLLCPLKRNAKARYYIFLEVMTGSHSGKLTWQFAGESGEVVVPSSTERSLKTILIPHPERSFGTWMIGPETQTLKIQPSDGFVSCRDVLLLRQGTPIGEGFQDIHLPFKLDPKKEPVLLRRGERIVDYIPSRKSPRARDIQPPQSAFTIPTSGVVIKPIAITAEEPNLVICYTLDGTFPAPTKPKYSGPIAVTNTVVLRAQAYSPKELRSVGSEQFGTYLAAGPKSFDYFFCTMVPADLYSRERGILNQLKVRGKESERPCHVTWIKKNGEQESGPAQLRIQGRWTRINRVKKNFRLEFSEKSFGGSFFDESVPLTEAIILKGHRGGKTHVNYACFRAAGLAAPYSRPVWLFVNGVPFGAYTALENIHSPPVLKRLYGTTDLDVYKEKSEQPWKSGTTEAFDQQWEMVSDLPMEQLDFVEPAYFARWMAMSSFLSPADAAQGYYVRPRNPPGTWRFGAWDLEGFLQVDAPLWHSLGGYREELWDRMVESPEFLKECDKQMESIVNMPYLQNGEPRKFYQWFQDQFIKEIEFEKMGLTAQRDVSAGKSIEELVAEMEGGMEYHKNYYDNRIARYQAYFKAKQEAEAGVSEEEEEEEEEEAAAAAAAAATTTTTTTTTTTKE